MNTKSLLSLAALAALPTVGFGQTFNFTAQGEGASSGDPLAATVDAVFSGTSLTFTVTNLNAPGSTYGSTLLGFYLLRPFTTDDPAVQVTLTPNTLPSGWSGSILTPGDFPSAWYPIYNPPAGAPEVTNESYYGANSGVSSGLSEGTSAVFTFTLNYNATVIDFDLWKASYAPPVLVRWQQVGPGSEDSGKGWGTGPGFDNAVPEPSAIAAMAVLGLGGLLLVRRRLIRKQK